MFVLYAIVGGLLAAMLLVSALGSIRGIEPVVVAMTKAGVPRHWLPRLGAVKALGAVGLIVGMWVPLVGVLAATGVCLYFLAAIGFHLRVGDRAVAPPFVLLVLAVVALFARAASW